MWRNMTLHKVMKKRVGRLDIDSFYTGFVRTLSGILLHRKKNERGIKMLFLLCYLSVSMAVMAFALHRSIRKALYSYTNIVLIGGLLFNTVFLIVCTRFLLAVPTGTEVDFVYFYKTLFARNRKGRKSRETSILFAMMGCNEAGWSWQSDALILLFQSFPVQIQDRFQPKRCCWSVVITPLIPELHGAVLSFQHGCTVAKLPHITLRSEVLRPGKAHTQ